MPCSTSAPTLRRASAPPRPPSTAPSTPTTTTPPSTSSGGRPPPPATRPPRPPGEDAGSAPGTKSVNAAISGLSSYTSYHYRIVAVNSLGTSYGEDEVLRTTAPQPPTIGTTSATDVSRDRATIHTVVNPA